MTTRRKTLGFLGGVAMAAMTATAAFAQEVTLKLEHFLPAGANVPVEILDVWANNLERNSNGRIKIERYATMSLGGTPPELIDHVQDGIVDIGWVVVGYTPGRYPTTEVFELPFMVQDADAASYAFWKMHERHMKDAETPKAGERPTSVIKNPMPATINRARAVYISRKCAAWK